MNKGQSEPHPRKIAGTGELYPHIPDKKDKELYSEPVSRLAGRHNRATGKRQPLNGPAAWRIKPYIT